jgi:chemotaxis protein MotA
MPNAIGFVLIFACVFGGFMLAGGKMGIVLEALPHEMLTIGGASLGALIVGNQTAILKQCGKGVLHAFKGPRIQRKEYTQLLCLMFELLSTFRKGGATVLEPHLDGPKESNIFTKYPAILDDHHLVEFICDYLRLMTLNFEDPNQLTEAMENDIGRIHEEELAPHHSLQAMADGLPAIGIVAAVLGVIKTMGSIDQPVEILGAMIGGALVGTFLGVLLSYCMVGPLAQKLKQVVELESMTFSIVKTAIVAYANKLAPPVAIEISRRMVPGIYAPSFLELDGELENVRSEMK